MVSHELLAIYLPSSEISRKKTFILHHRAGAGVEEQRAGGRLEDYRQILSGMVTGWGGKGIGARVRGARGHRGRAALD
jgi:hypothetical protein